MWSVPLVLCTVNQNSPRVDWRGVGISVRIPPPNRSSSWSSPIIFTPSLVALSIFDPDESPETRKSRLPDTDDTTFPPCAFMESAISFLGLLRVPVMQKVSPFNVPCETVFLSSTITIFE